MTFPSTIATARRALNLTQAGLAALLDVDKQSVSNWECGRNVPWPARQVEILRRLNLPAAPSRHRGRPSINERILR